MNCIINAVRGFCMALADSVPGVSGGTVAFILGFYDEFVNSLNDLAFGDIKKKRSAAVFLIKLGIGWAIGMAIAASVLTNLFESHIYTVSSVFIGFIVFSVPLIIKEEKDSLAGKYANIVFAVAGAAVVVLITYFNPMSQNANSVDISNLNIGLALYVFIAAGVAISAMVLPGISGSTLLLIFGLYIPIMSAVKELIHFNLSSLPVLAVFAAGIAAGILSVIRLIKLALNKYRSQSVYCIIGLMLGSLYAIVMGPTTLNEGMAPLSLTTLSMPAFVVGGIIIMGLELLKKVLKKNN